LARYCKQQTKIAPGIFAGYTKNNGLSDAGYKALYMRGLNGTTRAVDNVWRVSARVDFKENKFKLTPEVEYTAATWGTMDTSAKVTAKKTLEISEHWLVQLIHSKKFNNTKKTIFMSHEFNSQAEHDATLMIAKKKHSMEHYYGFIFRTLSEWYDFYIFGSLAVILSTKFFPADNLQLHFYLP
jgi:hypothetical protein